MKNITRWLATMGMLLVAFVSGCGHLVETKAEHSINDLLPRYLGPADHYTTRVSGHSDAIWRGHLRGVHIEGTNVGLTQTLTVNRLTIELSDISVDRRSRTVQKIGEARFAARLTEEAVNRYVMTHKHPLRDLSVSFDTGNKVTITARPELLGYATVPVSVRGTVRLEPDGKHLDFFPDAAQVHVGVTIGTALPGFIAEHIASRVNPITDLSDAPFPVVADIVIVERGAATITGSVPAEALREAIEKARK